MMFVSCNYKAKVSQSSQGIMIQGSPTMNTIRNSYFFTRVVIWFRAGPVPSVTIATSTLQVQELAYRASPSHDEWISRHYSKVDNLETFRVNHEMIDRIRHTMARICAAVCADGDGYTRRSSSDSNWMFQPRDDGWFASYDGKPGDILAFRRWLSAILM